MPRSSTPSPKSRSAKPGSPKSGSSGSGINLVVLDGPASAAAETRRLPSGRTLVTVAVRVPGPTSGGAATSVPVACWDPPDWVTRIEAETPLVVVGAVRRRFYRDGRGATASRVEVEATTIALGARRSRREAARRRAASVLASLT